MEDKLRRTVYFLKFWIYFSPLVGGLYLALWIVQIYNFELFEKLNILFGFIPNLFDKIYLVTADLNGMDVPMGYVYFATLSVLSALVAIKIENYLIDSHNEKEHKISAGNLRRRFLRHKGKMGNSRLAVEPSSYFFGLLEMRFECLEGFDKTYEDLEKLRKEYSKLLINKLKEKYPDVQFVLSGKIFIISREFSIFDNFLNDVIRFFSVFQETNNEKFISSSLVLSFDAGDATTNPKYIYRFLSKINDLDNLNKVIVLEKFAKKYKYVLTKQYISVPSGVQRIELDNSEYEVGLHYLENE